MEESPDSWVMPRNVGERTQKTGVTINSEVVPFQPRNKWAAVCSYSALAPAMSAILLIPMIVAGWIAILSAVLLLALYRIVLSHRDHRVLAVRGGRAHPLHRKLKNKEEAADRHGVALTIAAALYTLGLAILLASQLFDAILHKVLTLFAIR